MPRTSRPLEVHPIVLRRVEVTGVAEVTPNLRRLTLSGPELRAGEMGAGFARPAFRSDGFDDHVKMVVPPADGQLPRIGTQEEKRFAWNPEVLEFTRDYTVRSWDEATGSFDIEVVRHDHGLAAEWAFAAEPGDVIHVAGPKSCAGLNVEADWHLLVGDETALPAIARWLEEAPEGAEAHVVVEVPTAADRVEVPTRAKVHVEWLVRGEIPAGESTQLAEAVRRFVPPAGRGYAWVSGEAITIAPIRRYLRNELGLPKEDVEVCGYWRRRSQADAEPTADEATQEANRDDAERLAPPPAEESAMDILHDVHEMTELAPAVVTRVAVTLGIGPLVAAGTDTLTGLSAATAVPATRLAPLLDAMSALGLVRVDGERYRNTPRGGVLMTDDAHEELSLDNPANREVLALVDLVDVLRTGRPTARFGEGTWRERRAADAELEAAHHERAADELQYVLSPLAALEPVARARTLAIAGDAAGLLASHLGAGRTVHRPESTATAWPRHDCAVLVAALEGRTDDEAVALLRAALSSGPALVLAERVADKAAEDDHVAEHALTSLVLTGAPLRTRGQVEELLRRAGARTLDHAVLGWGFGQLSRVVVAQG